MTIFSPRCRTLIFYFVVLFFIAACAHVNEVKIKDRINSKSQIVGFMWDTRGGGDMQFAVEREGKHYKIKVERYNFHTIKIIITLTENNGGVYRLVDDIFEKRVDLHNYASVPKGLTGTWTEITLTYKDHRETVINNINAVKLNVLYRFVHNAVREL